MNREEFKQAQIKILEWLFQGRDRITNLKENHPAKIRWNYLQKISNQFVKWPEDSLHMTTLSRSLLDNYTIVAASGGNVQALNPGSMNNYGDALVQKKLLSEIIDENKFSDVLLEISFAAWNKSKGFEISASEENGMPDFSIENCTYEFPIIIDCKNIHKGTNFNRFGKIIRKANKQIKNFPKEGYGLVVIDITDFIEPINIIKDDIPEIVEQVRAEISKQMFRNNSSVNFALLLWHDWQMQGTPPQSSMITLRKRSLLINHSNPKIESPEDIHIKEYGNTVNFWIHWSPRR